MHVAHHNHRRRKIIVGSTALLALGVMGSPPISAATPATISVLFPGIVPYFTAQLEGMQEVAKVHRITIEPLYANWDAVVQVRQVESALSSTNAAVCLCASDNRALRLRPNLLNRHPHSVPLFTFTNAIGDAPDGQYPGISGFVGRDELEAGRMLGSFVQKIVTDKAAKILLVEGSPGTSPQRLRTQGLLSVVEQHTNWRVVRRMAIQGWREDLAELELSRTLPLDIDVIVTHWAGAAVAAARVLRKRGLRRVPIVTLEFTRALQREMQDGFVQFSTTLEVREEGRGLLQMVVKHLAGEPYPAFGKITQTVVDPHRAARLLPEW